MDVNDKSAPAGRVDLPSWREGPAKQAVVDFVRRTCGEDGAEAVPVEERVAVFDNDGTLWCEKPMPIQLDFILRRLVEMATAEPTLQGRQPWKAAYERDYGWLGTLLAEHYAGDDRNANVLAAGVLAAYDGITVEDFEAESGAFLRTARHPTLNRGYCDCAYTPMVDLLDYLDDGPEKPLRIWSRTGRRPLLAAGNSNGDVPMLHFSQHKDKASLRLLVRHDDADREFAYTAGAEQALEQADQDGWTVVSVKNDWATVFAPTDGIDRAARPS